MDWIDIRRDRKYVTLTNLVIYFIGKWHQQIILHVVPASSRI